MKPFSKYLTDATTGAITNANGDYTTPLAFQAVVPAGKMWRIEKLAVTIEDGTGMDTTTYGGLAALSNGVTVRVLGVDGTVRDTLATAIKSNTGWKTVAGDGETVTLTNDLFTCVWEFAEPLDLTATEAFQVLLSDNMTGIITQNFAIQGSEFSDVGTGFARSYISALTIPATVTSGINEDYSVTVKDLTGKSAITDVDIVIATTANSASASGDVYTASGVATTGAGSYVIYPRVTYTNGETQNGAMETLTVVAQDATISGITPDVASDGISESFTVTVTPAGESVVDQVTFVWGDGGLNSVDAAAPYTQSHTYSGAGTYDAYVIVLFSDGTTKQSTPTTITVS